MNRERGFALVTSIVVIALIMAAGAMLAASLQFRQWALRQAVQGVHLTALTDAGIALALDGLSRDHFWPGAGERPLGDGTFEVSVEMAGMIRVVTVTATWGPAVRAIRAEVRLSDYFPPRVVAWRAVPVDEP